MSEESEPTAGAQFDTVTPENYEAASQELSRLTWEGDYDKALPLADKLLAHRTERGERDTALVSHASTYYSAASRIWSERKTRGTFKSLWGAGKAMLTALRSLDERIGSEERKQGGPRNDGSIPSLDGMSVDELDVTQTVYRRAGEVVHAVSKKIPIVNSIVQFFAPTRTGNFVRDCDTVAVHAIDTGLKKIDAAKAAGETVVPHTEIFLNGGALEIATRHGQVDQVAARSQKILELGGQYPWPPLDASADYVAGHMTDFGQAVRVARKLADAARAVGDTAKAEEYESIARQYAQFVPDQKAKL